MRTATREFIEQKNNITFITKLNERKRFPYVAATQQPNRIISFLFLVSIKNTFAFIPTKVFQNKYVHYLLVCPPPAINVLPEYVPFCINT